MEEGIDRPEASSTPLHELVYAVPAGLIICGIAAVRCGMSRRWLILVVPLGLAPVLVGLLVLLAFNNWQY